MATPVQVLQELWQHSLFGESWSGFVQAVQSFLVGPLQSAHDPSQHLPPPVTAAGAVQLVH